MSYNPQRALSNSREAERPKTANRSVRWKSPLVNVEDQRPQTAPAVMRRRETSYSTSFGEEALLPPLKTKVLLDPLTLTKSVQVRELLEAAEVRRKPPLEVLQISVCLTCMKRVRLYLAVLIRMYSLIRLKHTLCRDTLFFTS